MVLNCAVFLDVNNNFVHDFLYMQSFKEYFLPDCLLLPRILIAIILFVLTSNLLCHGSV